MSRLKRETWKMHPEFTNYEISNQGQIKRRTDGTNAKKGFILKPNPSYKGYTFVRLRKDNKYHHKFVHRVVLETFIGVCPKGYECNHKDQQRNNNSLSNLEWVTSSENARHSWEKGRVSLKGEKCGNSKLKEGEVWLMKRILSINKIPQTIVAKMFKISVSVVSSIKNKKTWKHI